MTRILSAAAFFLGAIIVVWMGLAFVGSNLLALTVTLVIGAVYALGYSELLRYQQQTSILSRALEALANPVTDLNAWLGKLPASLQNSVRLRIQGEHAGLPAPVLAPYLIGLLVMLGLLGTFVGMVDTLKGAVMALEGTTELEAIRAGLAAPMKGLGMAFGTSVAGVAASAMLGLIATLSRRERMLAARQLDSKISSVLQDHSLAYNRQQTFQAMQAQAQALPAVAEKLSLLIEQVGRMTDQVSTRLATNQDQFHDSARTAYRQLASSIDASLQQSLAASGRLAGESIEPLVKELLQGISRSLETSQQQLSAATRQQLDTISAQFVTTATDVSSAWQAGLAAHQQANADLIDRAGTNLDLYSRQFSGASNQLLETFTSASDAWVARQQAADEARLEHWTGAVTRTTDALQQTASAMASQTESTASHMLAEIGALVQSSEALVQTRIDTEAKWLDGHSERMAQLTATLQEQLEALRSAEQLRGDQAVSRLAELQAAVAEHLTRLGCSLEEPMSRLIETAAETPRAAAEVIAKLRAEISSNIERDNNLLDERRRSMEELSAISRSMEQTTLSQRQAIEELVNSSATMLQEVGTRFSDFVGAEGVKLADVIDHFAGSTTELASLGEAFALAVQMFSATNGQLIESLTQIEESLQNSSTRSDEQLAYYVAQAREIIDQSMLSQQDIIDQLRQLGSAEQLVLEGLGQE